MIRGRGDTPGQYRVDLASGNLERTPDPYRITAPDGSAAYAGGPKLTRYDTQTGQKTELWRGDEVYSLAVSPDSRDVAFVVGGGLPSARMIGIVPASGGPAREVFRAPDILGDNAISWTPDKRYVLFVRGSRTEWSIWRVPAGGGQAEPVGVSRPAVIRAPQMHPDGKRLFFTGSEPYSAEFFALETLGLSRSAAK